MGVVVRGLKWVALAVPGEQCDQKGNTEHIWSWSVAPVEQCKIANEWKWFRGLGHGPRNMGQWELGQYREQGMGVIWWDMWRVRGWFTGHG